MDGLPATHGPFGARVAVLLFDRPAVFEMAIACEVWGQDRTAHGVPRSDVRLCSPDGPRLTTDIGFEIGVEAGLSAVGWADTVVVPSAPRPVGVNQVGRRVLDGLRRAHGRGARIVTFCSGSFVLAETGLLDGRQATTHWVYADEFRHRFPSVALDRDVLYVGGERLYTSAGTAAGIDLCLHLVRSDWGAEIANTVARRMVVPPHRDGGQAQYVQRPIAVRAEVDGDLRALLDWLQANLHRELTIDEMARRAAMAPRTFARRFRQSTGTTPLQWVLQQRVLLAQRMLERSGLGIDRIAIECGFSSAAALRQHFARIVGSTPSAYRAAFGTAA